MSSRRWYPTDGNALGLWGVLAVTRRLMSMSMSDSLNVNVNRSLLMPEPYEPWDEWKHGALWEQGVIGGYQDLSVGGRSVGGHGRFLSRLRDVARRDPLENFTRINFTRITQGGSAQAGRNERQRWPQPIDAREGELRESP